MNNTKKALIGLLASSNFARGLQIQSDDTTNDLLQQLRLAQTSAHESEYATIAHDGGQMFQTQQRYKRRFTTEYEFEEYTWEDFVEEPFILDEVEYDYDALTWEVSEERMFEYIMENYEITSDEMFEKILTKYWEEISAILFPEWLEERHIERQQELRESHDAEQAALKEEWDI